MKKTFNVKKTMKSVKKYMKKPYSKGDYYGGLAVCAALYGALLGGIAIAGAVEERRNIRDTGNKYGIKLSSEQEDSEDIDTDVIKEAINEDEA